jgi:hypothetical protein
MVFLAVTEWENVQVHADSGGDLGQGKYSLNDSLINANKMSHHSTFYFLFCHSLYVLDTFRVHHQEIK